METALADVRVLDFTHYTAGPYCTKLLADYGADVIKLEPLQGEPARRLGPFPQDQPDPEKSGIFLHLNTNKRGIVLNLKHERGREIALRIAGQVDLVVESFRPGVMDSLGLGYESLKAVNPDVVLTSISNFGQTGPYRDYKGSEIIFYGLGGEMYSTGLPDREPVKLGGKVGLYQAGTIAAVATMGAFFAARYQGIGQHVDVSIMETQAGSQDRRMPALVGYAYAGVLTKRTVPGTTHYPQGVYPCADGYYDFASPVGRFQSFRAMLGYPEFMEDPRWHGPNGPTDPELREEFDAHFLGWCMEHTKRELWEVAQAHRIISGPLNTMEDVAQDPVFEERGCFRETTLRDGSPLKMLARPFIMSGTPWRVDRPAPKLGQHTVEVLSDLGYTPEDVDALRDEGVI